MYFFWQRDLTPSRLLCCHFTSFFLPIFVSRVLYTELELMLKIRQVTMVVNNVALISQVFFRGFVPQSFPITTLLIILLCCYLTTCLPLFWWLLIIIIFVLQKRSPVHLTMGSYTNRETPLMTKPAKADVLALTPAILFVNPSIVPQVSSEEVRTFWYELMGLSINIFFLCHIEWNTLTMWQKTCLTAKNKMIVQALNYMCQAILMTQ